jgi:hypothetical protein
MSLKSVSPAAGHGEARQEPETKHPANNRRQVVTQANVLAAGRPPTAQSLQLQRRRVDRRGSGAARVRTAMIRGATLYLHHERGRPLWLLSTGASVPDDVARAVVTFPDIVSCGDGLFCNVPGQSWRYVES